jgi:N-ethylmaleimide reductase
MSQLLSQVTFRSLSLKNRVVMAPMTRGRADPVTRIPNDDMRIYYEQRAGAGLIITEATAVSPQGHGWYGAPGCYTEEQAAAWKIITDAVHAKEGKIFLQLWHMGRQSHSSFHATNEIVSASAIKIPGDGHVRDKDYNKVPFETPRALNTEEVKQVVLDYQNCARLAKQAGFDGVEIHGANGYLIDQFLQTCSNERTDEYGGSRENRMRFLIEVVEAILREFPSDRVGLRLSPNGAYGGMGSEDNDILFPEVASAMKRYELAYLHVMDGLGFGFHAKCKAVTLHDMKKNFEGPIIGNVTYTKDTAEGAIRTGAADLIAFGRLFISNPDLVDRFANNWPLAPDAPYEAWWEPGNLHLYHGWPAYKPEEESK